MLTITNPVEITAASMAYWVKGLRMQHEMLNCSYRMMMVWSPFSSLNIKLSSEEAASPKLKTVETPVA